MESKITIAVGENHKPVIKVIEKLSDDVRDDLVRNFRHLLAYKSKTLSIDFTAVEDNALAGYYIKPVEDELGYFEELITDVYVHDKANKDHLLKIAKLICEAFGGTLEMVDASDSFTKTGRLDYIGKQELE